MADQDDPHRRVLGVGDTVRRPMQPWSATIHELLVRQQPAACPWGRPSPISTAATTSGAAVRAALGGRR
ncbi:MAG TPA: hypothetical protein VFY84_11325 [Jiangellales bacterium]|nr:hypothetical protein [Jiangellales bacterium]